MAKKKINSIEKIENEELVTTKSVTSIISEDKNNIADATTEAKKNIDSIVYADNLVPPSKNSKSIRSLNIEEKKNKKDEDKINEIKKEDKTDETKKEKKDISKTKTSSNKKSSKDNVSQDNNKKPQAKKSTNKNTKKEVIKSNKNNIEDKKIESDNKEKNTEIVVETNTKDIPSDLKVEEIKEEIIELTKEKKSHKNLFIISFSIIATLLLLLIFSTIFAIINGTKTTIINGVKIKDIDVSNLTKEQAIEKVSNILKENIEKEITLQYKNYELTVFPSQFNVNFNIEEAVNIAYEKGRIRKYF